MSKLYVANTTKQHHDFCYRFPEEKNVRIETIRAGTQVAVGGDLQHDVIAGIIEQHAPYGLKEAASLSRLRDYVGLCYSIDKPVPLDNLLFTFEHNASRLNERAAERREEAAAAIAQNVRTTAAELGVSVSRTEVEMIEETRGEPQVADRFEILEEGVTSRHASRPGRRGDRSATA